jgi:hypothetical protein
MPPRRKREVATPTASIETGMLEMFANPERMGTTHEASTVDMRSDGSERSACNAHEAEAECVDEYTAVTSLAHDAGADAVVIPPDAAVMPPEAEPVRKRDAFVRLKRLQSAGHTLTREIAPDDDLGVLEDEVLLQEAMLRERQREQRTKDGVRFSRRMLLAFTSFTEFMNKRYDPFDIDIDGWSDSVMENIVDYDRPFERLLEKYQGRAEMTPEMELLATLGSSMFMFHLSKSMAARMGATASAQTPRHSNLSPTSRTTPPAPEIAVSDASSDTE